VTNVSRFLILLACIVSGTVRADGEPPRFVKVLAIKAPGSDFAFSPDGKRIASATSSDEVVIRDTHTGRQLVVVKPRCQRRVRCIAFSPDGKWLACGRTKGVLEFLDAETGQRSFFLPGHSGSGPIDSIAFHPDGKRCVIFCRQEMQIWDIQTRQQLRARSTLFRVRCVRFSPDGKQIVHSHGGNVVLRDAEHGSVLETFETSWPVLSVAFSPDGRRLVCGGVKALRFLDVKNLQQTREIESKNVITTVEFSPDGQYVFSGGYDDVATTVRDAKTGQIVKVLDGHGFPDVVDDIRFIASSADGKRMVSAGGETIMVWEMQNSARAENEQHDDDERPQPAVHNSVLPVRE